MKTLKTVISLCLSIVVLCAVLVPVFAADETVGYGEFTNESNDTPDLYVRKTVVPAVPDVEIPLDTEFRFVVKVGGRFYANTEYELYNSDGDRLYRKYDQSGSTYSETTDKDAVGVDVPFETDHNGGFTLKAGQTAKFVWVGKGVAYEVTEDVPADTHFVQTNPAGGAARTGTIEPKGSLADFENTYYPETHAAQTDLEVAKRIFLPDGFECPATPEFTFLLTVGGKPYAGQTYTLQDGTQGVTDENGQFKLKGEQTATFKGVAANLDYSVQEMGTAEGWRQTGSSGAAGATKAPLTHAEFTNGFANFAVTKRMEGYSVPDGVLFQFLLLTNDSTPISGAKYYLYNADKTLLSPDPFTTDTDGGFSLAAGQTALFAGMDSGTEFKVHEVVQDGYIQTSPNGDIEGIAQDNSIPVYEFVNAVDGDAKLTVKKVDSDGQPLSDVKFKVRKGSGLLPTYAKLEEQDGVWRIKGWGWSGTEVATDGNGEFVIDGFEAGTYALVESDAPSGYVKMKPVVFDIALVTSDENELIDITLTRNSENAKRTDVVLSGSMMDGTGLLTLTNRLKADMPNAGGPGRGLWIASGCAVAVFGLSLAVITLVRKKRSRTR